MLGKIPAPPMPSPAALLAAGVLCLAVGLALVIRGRANGRGILALLAAAAAAASAPLILQVVPGFSNVALTALAAGVTAGLLGFVLSRVLWGFLLGAILGGAALAIAAWISAPGIADKPPLPQGQIDSVGAWCGQMTLYLADWVVTLWQQKHAAVAVAAGLVTLGAACGVLLPRITLIVTTSAVGAVAMAAGAAMLLWASNLGWTERVILPVAVAATILTLIGAGFQTWRESIKAKAAEKESPEPGAPGRPDKDRG